MVIVRLNISATPCGQRPMGTPEREMHNVGELTC